MIDDGTVTRRGEHEFFWTAADPCFRWFAMNAAGLDAEIEDVSEQVAGLALQGPRSRAIARGRDPPGVVGRPLLRPPPRPRSAAWTSTSRAPATPGDLGYEVWVPAEAALEVWDALWEAGEPHGIRPAGIRALDVARVEAGLILIEAEYTSARHAISLEQQYSPFEIGLGRLVDLGKPTFVGRRALELERRRGGPAAPARRARARLDRHRGDVRAPRPASDGVRRRAARRRARLQGGRARRPGDEHRLGTDDQEDGRVRLAPARISPGVGTRVSVEWSVEGERGKVGATVVELPFLDLARKRA